MQLFPAIDLRDGKVVQLTQGDFDRERIHGDDPVAVAQSFVAAGAPWIHTVDLDAARTGEPVNRALIGAIAAAVNVPVQAGGGVRSAEAAAALADLGVARVVMGTAAMDDPDLVATIAGRQPVALGLDVRGREVAVRGWAEGSGIEWPTALRRLADAGAEAVVVTQIEVEGLMGGADTEGLAEVLAATDLDVIASGGVGTLDDLLALDAIVAGGRRLAGAIVGTAIYEGRVDVAEAVAALGMKTARIIPCLDVDDGRVVKGVNFVDLIDAGDPVELAARYDAEGADELVFLDITASSDARDTTVEMAARVAEQVFIPFTIGGGIRSRRGRPPAAASRGRQGVGEHVGRRAPRADQRDRRGVRYAVLRGGDRRSPNGPRLRGVHARRPDADGDRCPRLGSIASRSSGPGRSS